MAEQTSYPRSPFSPTGSGSAAPANNLALTDGVLGRRFFAYLIDILIVFGLITLLGIAIFILGIVTFTLGWSLYALLFPPLVAILYSAVTVDVTIETRDAKHTAEVFQALAADGLEPQRIGMRGLSETAY